MWLSSKIFSILEVSKDSVDALREELAVVRAERDILKVQLVSAENRFDWLRLRVNTLEVERAQLLEKAYGIKTIIPELIRAPVHPTEFNSALFEDVGEDTAKQLGLPTYNS